MPQYIRLSDVQLRLVGKVRFTNDEEDENRMPNRLAKRLIDEAEGQVEQDLSPRYAAPFVDHDAGSFSSLPDRPTKNIIRTLCELKSVIRILETDFGAGSAVDGEKYIQRIEKRYRSIVDDNILRKVDGKEDQRQWYFPPLPGLKLNYFNTEADDGYVGMVLVTSQDDGDFPSKQINDPSESFWNGILDD